MAIIPSKSTVLVTGANGFIAAHCIKVLLSQSYMVHATVRSPAKASIVLSTHSNPNLFVHIVSDITAPGCYDEILSSHPCNAILHLASPFPATSTPGHYEEDLLIPAINGTLRVCETASQFASIKRVVLTSSFASVYDAAKGPNPGKTYTEDDWAPLTYDDGKNAPATPVAYRVSKVLAEKTAWEFLEKKNGDVGWDLVTLCPGMVFGAVMPGSITGLGELGTSNAIAWALFDKDEVPETRAPVWTSVSGLAVAHMKALSIPAAGNQRFLVTNGEYDMQELADILHASPTISVQVKKRVPVGTPGARLAGTHYKVDNSKATKILGLEEQRLDKTLMQLVEQLLEMEKGSRL